MITSIFCLLRALLVFPLTEHVAISSVEKRSVISFLVSDKAVLESLTAPNTSCAGRETRSPSTSSM